LDVVELPANKEENVILRANSVKTGDGDGNGGEDDAPAVKWANTDEKKRSTENESCKSSQKLIILRAKTGRKEIILIHSPISVNCLQLRQAEERAGGQ